MKYKRPSYIFLNKEAKKTFLSKIDNFTNKEIEIFDIICRFKKVTINYRELIDTLEIEINDYIVPFKKLLRKLEKHNLVLIRNYYSKNDSQNEINIIPKVLILFEFKANHYYIEKLDEIFNKYSINYEKHFPFLRDLLIEYNLILKDIIYINEDDIYDIKKGKFNKFKKNLIIFKVEHINNYYEIIFNTNMFDLLIRSIRNRLYYLLYINTELLNECSLLLNYKKNYLLTKIKIDDININRNFWKNLNSLINNYLFEKYNKSEEFFILLKFIIIYTKKVIEISIERDFKIKKIKKDIDNLVLRIKNNNNLYLIEEKLDMVLTSLKVEYSIEEYKNFENEFKNKNIIEKNKDFFELSNIVLINNIYIHKDNLIILFYNRIFYIKGNLKYFILDVLTLHLKNKKKINSRYEYEITIRNYINANDPILSLLFSRPKLILDAFLYEKRKESENPRLKFNNILPYLSFYFFIENDFKYVEFRDYSILFELDIKDLFLELYKNMSIIKKIRFYKSYQNYSKFFQKISNGIIYANKPIREIEDINIYK